MKSNRWDRLYLAVVVLFLAGVLIGPGSAFAGLNDGLVGYYSFNACTAADDSGTGNNGSFVGSNQCVQGVNGSALRFGGYYNRGYVNIPNSPSLSFLDNYTFTLWFNIQSSQSMDGYGGVSDYGMHSLFAKAGDRNGLLIRTFRNTNDGLMRLLAHNGRFPSSDSFGMETTEGFGLNEWHMATVTSGNGEVKVYFDCALQTSIPTEQFKVNTRMQSMPLQLGIDQDARWYPINGILDETRVYNRALSADEVKALYRSGGLGHCPGENQPPVANAGPDHAVECAGPQGAAVTLDGSGSSDPDGDALTFTWTENGSVIATGENPAVTLSYGSHTITLTVDDAKGGTATDEVVIIIQDTTPPRSMINGITGTTGNNGWYRSAVTVRLLATDACTGVQEIRYSVDGGPDTVAPGENVSVAIAQDGSHGIAYFARDRAGNTETPHNTQPVKIDQTAPVITATTAPAPNHYGWNKTDVIVTFTCSDAVSGIASCTSPVTVTTEGSGRILTGTAVDAAGNDAVASATVNIDKTAPLITATVLPAANQYGWHSSDATVIFTCSDALSGIASCSDPITVTTEGAGQVISGAAVDKAGNTSTASVTLNIDKTAPTLNITVSPGMLWPPNHKMVTITPSITVADANPGTMVKLVSVTSSEPDNGLGDGDTANDIVINAENTMSLRAERSGKGSGRVYTITYQATDIAGNATTATATVTVPHNK